MKIFFSEYDAVYASYTFSYAVYCIPETPDELAQVYEKGFLPYSGNPALPNTIFYLARSVRVDLSRFTGCSENRRVDRKARGLGIDMAVRPLHSFRIDDRRFLDFCLTYVDARFAPGAMDKTRLQYILNNEFLSHIFVFSHANRHVGYILAIVGDAALHYWFAFYDAALMRSVSLGKWMMWRAIQWSQDAGMENIYLGTCYGGKSLYKIRDHSGVEFFDGVGWNREVAVLKRLCASDDCREQPSRDRFKEDGFPIGAIVPPSGRRESSQ